MLEHMTVSKELIYKEYNSELKPGLDSDHILSPITINWFAGVSRMWPAAHNVSVSVGAKQKPNQGVYRLRFMFGPPEDKLTKTQLHEAVVYSRVVSLAFFVWQVHNNPGAAIPPCANKPDNMEPYERIPMLTHALHGTGAPVICCKIAKRPRPGKQKLSPRHPPLRKVNEGKQLPPCHT
jgi:hypothetical protein